MPTTPPASRLAWLDHVRAAGILLVVAGHAIRSLDRSGLPTADWLVALDDAIYSFHMPLFFMLAGMTQGLGRRKGVAAALQALFWGIVLPYLIWSSVWVALKTGFADAVNAPVTGSPFAILWQPIDHFWFLYTLAILRIVWIGVEATGSALARRLAILVPLVAAFVGLPAAGGPVVDTYLFFWAAFYGVGVVAVHEAPEIRGRALVLLTLVAEVVWLGAMVLDPAAVDADFGPVRTLIAFAGVFTLIGTVLICAPGGLAGRLAGFVGEASLAIFLTHTLFGAVARLALERLGLLSPGTLLVAAIVAGVVGPTLAYAAVLRADAALGRPLARWIGFGTQRRSHYFDLGRPARAAGGAVSLDGRAG
ncbi:acyltransferase family protein [Oharaeibacter diazotrophicus]|uniref:Fucose 4-O-acetylase-like acetyltransferase n=1 Tax=Oharaeibacter diazotrophicus TaxID=1920512 RepID=A0A4R6R7V5_9HYPH|nr:acyltransferase family protein [Oharaeibacter diazotrophicus]TDP81972.1 fucose 4-O-acetylase-like acetyltransferase [Oharaeibacter diazotrophicus]BBE73604.1 acyltransferase family protein [Pleomorphomonas sp. SM30]GLS75394.1 hypothetical protein GCM10007904_07290 [Oharaeibacter diazotrophicus]